MAKKATGKFTTDDATSITDPVYVSSSSKKSGKKRPVKKQASKKKK